MSEPNPMAVIAGCIEKSKGTTDQELIGDYIAEALGVLQIDNTEDDAFNMLGSAIVDAVADDEGAYRRLARGLDGVGRAAEAVVAPQPNASP